MDCCYPVKCIAGHYGELIFGQREKLDILFSPMIYNLPSFLSGHVDALRKAYGPEGTPRRRRVHTLRLPLQAPLIAWAWTLTRRNRRP